MPSDTISADILAAIAKRAGEAQRLLALHKQVQDHLALLAGHAGSVVSIIVQVHGAPFTMKVPVAVLVAQHEDDLAKLGGYLLDAGSLPLAWIPPAPLAVPADDAPASPPLPPTTDGASTHG